MSSPLRQHAQIILRRALEAVQPDRLIRQNLQREGHTLRMGDLVLDLSSTRRLLVIGAGKGVAPMAVALEELVGDHLHSGAIMVKCGHGLPLSLIRGYEGGHPVMDAASLSGTQNLLDLLQGLTADDLVLVLLTGGGSALLELPAPGMSLRELQAVNKLLLSCGADIVELSTVRKHLSQVKGGQLLRWLKPARVITLAISDVIGDSPENIASGPTVPDPTTFSDAWNIIEKYQLQDQLPETARLHLRSGLKGNLPETPKPGDPLFQDTHYYLLGNNRLLLNAAHQAAEELGYKAVIISHRMQGEASQQGFRLAALCETLSSQWQPLCLLLGGETTVTLLSSGKGGRNQELALAAGIKMAGLTGALLLAAGSDGTDGPTEAAGAIVDGATLSRAQALGLNAAHYLRKHDSYTFFQALDDLVITGPTRTNVMDLVLLLKRPAE